MRGKAEQGVRQGQGTEKAEYRATVQVMTRKNERQRGGVEEKVRKGQCRSGQCHWVRFSVKSHNTAWHRAGRVQGGQGMGRAGSQVSEGRAGQLPVTGPWQ